MNHHKNIVYVFSVHPHPEKDEIHHALRGKLWIQNGHATVLEDHGLAEHPLESYSADDAARIVHRLMRSQRSIVATAHELRTGRHPELLPTITDKTPSNLSEALGHEAPAGHKVSEFEYHREGMPAPQSLKVSGTASYLDDQPLGPDELQRVLANLQSGKATLRHLAKSEDLVKIEPHLATALGQIRNAVRQGHVHPDALRTVNRSLFTDTMVPTIGNRAAYRDFMSRPREGVHVHLDGNDFGSINKTHSHEVGNHAIIAMGKALRSAMDEAVGRKNGKLFRTGGDEFVAHVPTHEHAALFARTLRNKLEAIPAIRGTHRLSMSLGFGPTHEHAEEALKDAKAAKRAANALPGQAQTHAASRMPGREGLIPVD